MSDTISRRQAIEALRRNQEAYLHDNYFDKIDNYTAKIVETDIETLTELPSAQPETNCSEIPNNSDTISRQAAIDLWEKYHPTIAVDAMQYDAELRQMPPAQPEIIRCKDCKHHHRDNSGAYYCGRKDYGYGWGLNDFCSDAERRTDG